MIKRMFGPKEQLSYLYLLYIENQTKQSTRQRTKHAKDYNNNASYSITTNKIKARPLDLQLEFLKTKQNKEYFAN